MKRALIMGITGQDGVYLADFLLQKDYEVIGTFRRTSHRSLERLEAFNMMDKVELLKMDLTDQISINKTIKNAQADEIYNLGAQSFVGASFDQPILTSNINGLGPLRVFETVKELSPHSKIYHASSSEMFGDVLETPQTELTPFRPQSPYACAKVYAFHQTVNYRESYDMFAVNGILFNHESPRRGETFVSRKITRGLCNISQGLESCLYMGNMNSLRSKLSGQ